jgi:Xaa-Pro aminopeptidase
VNKKEFPKRRRQLMRMVGSDGIAILPAAAPRTRSRDVEYAYRPDSDFFYLTGFPEPEAVAVLMPGRTQGEYVLFCRDRDRVRETWDGFRAGPDGAIEKYGADDAFPISDIDDILPGLLECCERVYYTMGVHPGFDKRVIGWVNSLKAKGQSGTHTPQEFVALDHLLHDMRLYKSRSEISAMRRAAKIAVKAHKRAMQLCEPGVMEYEVYAELMHEFHRNGSDASYHPIVAGGGNACVLHYTENNDELKDGDLLLIDAGCEHECYASDITRTFPVNGRFTATQRAIYEVVLDAQRAAIDAVRVGNHWNAPHEVAVRCITKGLKKLGLLKGDIRTLIRDEACKRFFMHRTGHWLGIDVHDVGDYKVGDEWRQLEPGMVLTVEPGIYIPAGSKGVPRKWWNTAVRIEDDVLVTLDGPDVLSRDLPTDPDEIEACVGAVA